MWIVPLMALAVANRETSVFIPALLIAKYGVGIVTDPRLRQPLLIALAAWGVGAIVYFAIHAYYGPQPRTEESYWGPDMFLNSISMRPQIPFFFAAVSLLPLLAIVALPRAGAFLRRLFWLVVPVWFAIHIWAARLGEGMLYLAPIALILVPIVLLGVQRLDDVGERLLRAAGVQQAGA
jgi:hypothetical protein